MSTKQTQVIEKNSLSIRQPIIDVDVHEMLPHHHDLAPYLEQPWKRWLTECGWNGTRQLPYVQHLPGGVEKMDAKPGDGRPAGSDYKLMKEQLLDKYDVEHAILTGLFYPSTMKAQYEFATALASAYNDWQIENWLDKDSRFKGSIHVAAQDPHSAAREIDRLASHPQMVQVLLPIASFSYGDPFYHPIFEAVERNGLLIAMHQSTHTTTALDNGYPRFFIDWHTLLPQAFMSQVVSLITNGVFEKFPSLKVIMLEGGFVWLPALMWRLDYNYKSLRQEVPWVKRMPSEYIKEHFHFATQPIEDADPKEMKQVIEMIGNEKTLLFATDYPHWDFDSPTRSLPTTLSKELKRKILFENAKEVYGL
ncbi:amidohydrolase family protein [Alteribacillus iranensis]|uniref:Predicted metal-dependent hydrolase, TIM-barrel fold n=1 Tax=Alteribacillus iranensis TaxID=930128 RepID=A0A1I2B8Y8_9BACI|nr:amidohydrolase family protein [Alteribacillus iranensis]SFE52672.1 Predicted metal-dependent hydrolase, TIM-barrel fold [Alteribacillus iranensis]